MIFKNIIAAFLLMAFASGCAFKSLHRSKNITYFPANTAANKEAQKLDVAAPAKKDGLKPVFIFLYGGNWNSGKKGLYRFFGNRMARKGIVTVIPDYPKSPKANFDEMALDAALATKWVKDNIQKYGGDPSKIFISGHSAGGHLAALISLNNDYFKRAGIDNPIKGTILIDAAGLDLYEYLRTGGIDDDPSYPITFTTDKEKWKFGSPIYYLNKNMPQMLIYRGGRTYPSIEESNEKFITALKKYIPEPAYHIQPKKKHVTMILQFFNSSNARYKEMIDFMKK